MHINDYLPANAVYVRELTETEKAAVIESNGVERWYGICDFNSELIAVATDLKTAVAAIENKGMSYMPLQ